MKCLLTSTIDSIKSTIKVEGDVDNLEGATNSFKFNNIIIFYENATLIKVFERTLGKARKSMGLFPLLFKYTRYKISLQEKYIFKAVRLF